VDNTTIDTACRKQKALKIYHGVEASLDKIRSDYELAPILGSGGEVAASFFIRLDTEEAITTCDAPAFPGAATTIELFRKNGFDIVFMTARQSNLREVTLSELLRNNIPCQERELWMPSSSDQGGEFKFQNVRKLSLERQIVAVIGDRPEDIKAAQGAAVPAILFKSTLKDPEVEAIVRADRSGLIVCSSWTEIATAVEKLQSGSAQMALLRTLFSEQYGSWLRDIDEKMKIVVAVAAVIVAFCGGELHENASYDFGWWLLLLTLIVSSLATVYAVRGFTSRYSSGTLSSSPVRTQLKQVFAVLLGWPQKWLHLPNDAIAEYRAIQHASEREQASAHLKFFYDRYRTHNPDALLNLRMLELRATNYSKLYAERIASNLLILAITLIVLWALRSAGAHVAHKTIGAVLDLLKRAR
jgi:phosphoglycolate phosphatase-like HAD superfamily hydrolase